MCATTQVAYVLVGRTGLELVNDAKLIGDEEPIPQQKLILVVFKIQATTDVSRFMAAKWNWWRLREAEVQIKLKMSLWNVVRKLLHQAVLNMLEKILRSVYLLRWIMFVTKERMVEYVKWDFVVE